MSKSVRHVLGLSGGKDSTALAVLLHKTIPDMEYFFCDTHKELPETYEYLERLKARLGITITHLSADRGFDHWLEVYGGVLPSPQVRWCTKQLKIKPLEEFIGDDEAFSYIGIRADENRAGYEATRPNIHPVFPFREANLGKQDIFRILEESGVGLPKYYEWRSRSGCYFCFYQRKYEWVMLHERHPDLFQKAVDYEENHSDGRIYTWSQGESLLDLIKRRDDIIADHEKALARQQPPTSNLKLLDALKLEGALEEDDDTLPCLSCHL
jgi:3'-phosphoadenosine 5'-phosphosulfate sulfotransferase (PAPS reductase)/FAD synthetase